MSTTLIRSTCSAARWNIIANTREIDWSTLGINFVLVFSPGALSAAPHTVLATVAMEGGNAAEEALERDVTARFNITSVRVKEVCRPSTVARRFRHDGALHRRRHAGGPFALVLAGAMAAGFSACVHAVALKVLGATTGR